jgi:hypothetical protein
MTIKLSDALANALLKGGTIDAELTGGFIYIFAGPVPANADAALDMTVSTGLHTQLVKIAADAVPVDSGVTGLQFAAAAASRALSKLASQTWAGKINFVGKDQGSAGVSPLTATFYRFCAAADNGQGAGTGSTPRIQGTVDVAGADLNLTSVSLSDNGANVQGISAYEIRVDS